MTWYRSKAVHHIYHFNKWVLLSALILVAVISLSGRIFLGKIELFKPEIEQLLEGYGIKGIGLENIHAEWDGFYPLFKINGASLSIPGQIHALSVNELEISFKLFQSLYNNNLQIKAFHLTIEKMIVLRDQQGLWNFNEISLQNQNANQPTDFATAFASLLQIMPDYLTVDIRQIQIKDLLHSREYLIQDSELTSHRRFGKLSLELHSLLPSILGSTVRILLTEQSNQQRVYLESQHLNIVEWANLFSLTDVPLHSAQVDLKSWFDLEDYHLQQITSDVQFVNVKSKHNPDLQQPISFSLRQKSQNLKELWRIDGQFDSVVKGGHALPGFNAQLLFKDIRQTPQQKTLLWIDALSVSSLSQVFGDAIDIKYQQQLKHFEPSALIRNIVAQIDIQNPSLSTVSLDFDRIKTRVFQSIPGVQGVSGHLIARQGTAKINLNSNNVSLDFAKLFRNPIQLNQMSANIYVNYRDGIGLIDAPSFTLKNDDLTMQGRMWLEIPETGVPFMSLRTDYQNGDAKATPKYLPVSIMQSSLVQWLDESIQDGQVERGDLIYHGRLEPFSRFRDNQSGEFEALFQLSDPRVKFLPDWPKVSEGQLTASFHNMGMQIDTLGTIFSHTRFDQVSVSIADFSDATLFINGSTDTPAETVLPTLSAMPVLNTFDQVLAKTQSVSGKVRVGLQINIPLSEEVIAPIVNAQAKLQDVSISIPQWMIGFDNMTGDFSLKENVIHVPDMKGKYYGDDVSLSVQTDSYRDRTRFHLQGKLRTQNLAQLLPKPLKDPLLGNSDWDVKLSIDNSNESTQPFIEMAAMSNLAGTAFAFPPPFNLGSDEKGQFSFNGNLSHQDKLRFEVDLDQRFQAQGLVNLKQESHEALQRLAINFTQQKGGSTSTMSSSQSGVSISGKIDKLDWVRWVDYIDHYFKGTATHSKNVLAKVDRVNVEIKEFKIGGQLASNTKINLSAQSDRLTGSIDSSLAKGQLEIPFESSIELPYKATLDYLKLIKPTEKDKQRKWTTAINDMPNVHIESESLYFDNKDFKRLTLRAHSEKNKFSIDQLDFHRDDIQLKSSGFWQLDTVNTEHVSVFNITVKGEDFGQTINELGFGESIRNGDIDFDGQIGWGGKIYDFDWSTLIGEVHLNLQDGYLRNVEPGAGRFVGLLSFNTLPRRLFLDFGDVVREGTQFKKINGTFKIKGEIMETENASMDGPSALVEIVGNTNLRQQTYDQTMYIYPKVGDTLPVIGGIAAGSAVGWGLLLLNKLFNDPIDKSVKIEYKVSGSWDEPLVTLIEKKVPAQNEETDFFGTSDSD